MPFPLKWVCPEDGTTLSATPLLGTNMAVPPGVSITIPLPCNPQTHSLSKLQAPHPRSSHPRQGNLEDQPVPCEGAAAAPLAWPPVLH